MPSSADCAEHRDHAAPLSGPFIVLLLALVSSGAAGLTYQLLWLRLLFLVFGVTAYAASTVLAGFMAGLAIGSVVAGRVASRARRPLRLFAAAELAIAITAVATATLLTRLPRGTGRHTRGRTPLAPLQGRSSPDSC